MEFLIQHASEAFVSDVMANGSDDAPLQLPKLGNQSATRSSNRIPIPSRQSHSERSADESSYQPRLHSTRAEQDVIDFEVDDEAALDSRGRSKRKPKSTFKGVFKCGKKFKAQIQTHGVQHYLGLYDTEEEAAKAYDSHARFVLGLKAKTNFPFDPRDVNGQSFMPVPTSNLRPPQNMEEADDSRDRGPLKRSYVGMKVRKQSAKDVFEAKKKGVFFSLPQPLNIMALDRGERHFHSSLHLPGPVASTAPSFLPLPHGYQPLLNSVKFSTGANAATGHPPELSHHHHDLEWSKVPYTPLDITGAYPYTAVNLTQTEPDWREQIYYWTGLLTYDTTRGCLAWTGKWLGSFTGRPMKEEFDSSSNEFEYFSQLVERSRVVMEGGIIKPTAGSYTGHYCMDNDGTGEMEEYTDKELIVEFDEVDSSSSLGSLSVCQVYGKGDSEFGVFILNGSFDPKSSVLNMNRQYLAENDLRKTMTLSQLKMHYKRQMP